jgi:hypothetical protein
MNIPSIYLNYALDVIQYIYETLKQYKKKYIYIYIYI